MRVEIHLLSQSQPMEYANVKNAYMKEGMYCILLRDGSVTKFPMVNIFRVKEFDDIDVELEEGVEYAIIEKSHTEEDLTLGGDKTLSNIHTILVPREFFGDILELNGIDITEDIGKMNCLSNGVKQIVYID